MALDYQITYEDRVVTVNVRGQFDFVSLDLMWRDIVATCKKHGCNRVLGIADIEKPTQDDAYDHAGILEYAGIPADYRIAWVEQNPDAKELAGLAAAVIRNRCVADGRVFDDVHAARRWLAADDV